MNDTLPEAQEFLDNLYKKFSGEQKILMASGMFDAARKIILSSLPKNLSKKEKIKALLLRLYEDDFSKKQMEEILATVDKKL